MPEYCYFGVTPHPDTGALYERQANGEYIPCIYVKFGDSAQATRPEDYETYNPIYPNLGQQRRDRLQQGQ